MLRVFMYNLCRNLNDTSCIIIIMTILLSVFNLQTSDPSIYLLIQAHYVSLFLQKRQFFA